MFKHGARALAVLATVGLLAGCSSGNSGGSTDPNEAPTDIVKGGDAVIAIAGDVDFLDPIRAGFVVTRQVFAAFCERLYEPRPDGSIGPQLATELPTVSDDGVTLTIPLRENVVFSDGTPFNAEAVKISLDRAVQSERSVRTSAKQSIKSVDVIDEHTVQVNLNYPFSPILAELGEYTGMIVSPTQLEKLGDEFGTEPVCVGPFDFESRAPGDNIVFTKSDTYYDKDKVNLDSLTFKVVADGNARAANVESGDIDFTAVSEPVYTRLKGNPNFISTLVEGIGYDGFTFNVGNVAGVAQPYGVPDNLFVQHPELREALVLSIDRDAYVKATFNDVRPASCSPIAESNVYALNIECEKADVARAKQLVEQSGVATPIKVQFVVPNAPEYTKGAQVIQAMVKEVGFELEIIPTETLATITQGLGGDFTLLAMGWSGRFDPNGNIQFETGDANNYAGYSNPEVDALIKEASQEFDVDARKDLYRQAVELFNEDYAYIYLSTTSSMFVGAKDFYPGELLPDGIILVKTAGFTGAQN